VFAGDTALGADVMYRVLQEDIALGADVMYRVFAGDSA